MEYLRIDKGEITSREEQVLQLIPEEHTDKEMAKKLFITDHTVISPRKSLMDKLGAKNTAGLVRRGFEYGILSIANHALVLMLVFAVIRVDAQKEILSKEGEGNPAPAKIVGLEVAPAHRVLFGDSLWGEGTRLMWLPEKGALRAGNTEQQWDSDYIGSNSASFGRNNESSGNNTFSWGSTNSAQGSSSTAWGWRNIVKGAIATAWGYENTIDTSAGWFGTVWGHENFIVPDGATAWGHENRIDSLKAHYATVWGEGNEVNQELATGWGKRNEVSAVLASAWGQSNVVSGTEATAWGNNNEAGGIGATAFGSGSRALGFRSVVMGFGLLNNGASSVVMGQHNDPLLADPEIATGIFQEGSPLFIVGNGQNEANKSNAMTVMDNGRVKIGNGLPLADLHIESSETNIGAGAGGLRIDDHDSDHYWQISISPEGHFKFVQNDELKAYVDENGNWNSIMGAGLSRSTSTSLKNNSNKVASNVEITNKENQFESEIEEIIINQSNKIERQAKLIESLLNQLDQTNKRISQIEQALKNEN